MILPARYVFDSHSGKRRVFARRLLEHAVRMAEQIGIPYLDFTTAIENGGGTRLYFDFAHLTEEGNHVVGEELSRHLTPQLRKALNPKF